MGFGHIPVGSAPKQLVTKMPEKKTSNPPSKPRSAEVIDTHVGSRMRLRRMQLGTSQEQLAKKLGVTFQQVQKYEKGLNRIGASRLFHIAKVLDVPIQFFFDDLAVAASKDASRNEGAGQLAPADAGVAAFFYSREGIELGKAFSGITDPRVRRTLISHVRALAEGDFNP
jgi:transcriptional regulator with XRE-family HTH domain